MNYKIISKHNRYIIVDYQNNLIDDANGHGFKSKPAAHKFMWYKNNETELAERKVIAEKFIEDNPNIKIYAELFDIDHIAQQTKIFADYNPWKDLLAKVKSQDKELYKKLCENLKIKNAIKRVMLESCGFIS